MLRPAAGMPLVLEVGLSGLFPSTLTLAKAGALLAVPATVFTVVKVFGALCKAGSSRAAIRSSAPRAAASDIAIRPAAFFTGKTLSSLLTGTGLSSVLMAIVACVETARNQAHRRG